jgi:hypothetical protein
LAKQTNPVLTTYERYTQSQSSKAGGGLSGRTTPSYQQQQQEQGEEEMVADGVATIIPTGSQTNSRPESALGDGFDRFLPASLRGLSSKPEQWVTIVVVGPPGGTEQQFQEALSLDTGLVILPGANVRIVGVPRCVPR